MTTWASFCNSKEECPGFWRSKPAVLVLSGTSENPCLGWRSYSLLESHQRVVSFVPQPDGERSVVSIRGRQEYMCVIIYGRILQTRHANAKRIHLIRLSQTERAATGDAIPSAGVELRPWHFALTARRPEGQQGHLIRFESTPLGEIRPRNRFACYERFRERALLIADDDAVDNINHTWRIIGGFRQFSQLASPEHLFGRLRGGARSDLILSMASTEEMSSAANDPRTMETKRRSHPEPDSVPERGLDRCCGRRPCPSPCLRANPASSGL